MKILPDRNEIKNPHDTEDDEIRVRHYDVRKWYELAVNTVYAKAKEVDIDTLAEEWSNDGRNWDYDRVVGTTVFVPVVKFSDFIKERVPEFKEG